MGEGRRKAFKSGGKIVGKREMRERGGKVVKAQGKIPRKESFVENGRKKRREREEEKEKKRKRIRERE